MQKPNLIIVAGCNGSGKSTFSKTYVSDIVPFDYDKRYLEIYSSLPDSELRERIAKNKTTEEFESSINGAFSNRENFCYETNFDNHPIEYLLAAKKLGYSITLHFYCLESIELAKERVEIRTSNKGHFVPDDVVSYKWKEGYKNLNLHFELFDYILLVDNSAHLEIPKNLFGLIKNGKGAFDVEKYMDYIPLYSERRYPKIFNLLMNLNN